MASLPARERGSKLFRVYLNLPGFCRSPRGSVDRNFSPTTRQASETMSLPARERGSKLKTRMGPPDVVLSLPARERGSKQLRGLRNCRGLESLPARERGSKRLERYDVVVELDGRSPRGSVDRNSKIASWPTPATAVAPRAGAWIETERPHRRGERRGSLPARERGSKLNTPGRVRRCGDVAPRAGAWIETLGAATGSAPRDCRSPRGSVDRNDADKPPIAEIVRSLPARERGSKPRMR